MNLQKSAEAIVRKYVTTEIGRAEPKEERETMSSSNGQRKQPTSHEGSQQKVAVKPQGYAGVPSPIPAQVGDNSRGDQNDLLERVLERGNLFRALKQVRKNGGACVYGSNGRSLKLGCETFGL